MATEVLIRGVAALGAMRLRELAHSDDDDVWVLAGKVISSLERPEDLSHRGLTEADIEAIGEALGLGTRAAWRPRISAEEFERLPFYQKPSYDQDVWTALLSIGVPATESVKPKAKPAKKPKAKAKPAKQPAKMKAKPAKKAAAKKPAAKKKPAKRGRSRR